TCGVFTLAFLEGFALRTACRILVGLFVFGCFRQAGAAPFQNLDFEQYSGLVPGWTFENDWTTPFNGSQILTRLPLDYGVNELSPNPPYATIYSKAHKPFGFPADTGNYLVALVPIT